MNLGDLLQVDPAAIAQLAGFIAIGVFLGVQALKVFGVVKDNAGKWALGIAGFIGIAAGVAYFVPVAGPVIAIVYGLFLGAVTAGLFYQYLAKPFFEKLGLDVSTSDLNGA
jgi:hypothetical protein